MRRAAFALALFLAAPAQAQDAPQQTVEGAQRFLAILAEQRQLVIIASGDAGATAMANYWAESAEGEDCRTRFATRPRAYQWAGKARFQSDQPGFREDDFARIIARYSLPVPPFAVDWSRISGVQLFPIGPGNELQGVRIAQGDHALELYVPDSALAQRVVYAAEFLKAACDRTAETGF